VLIPPVMRAVGRREAGFRDAIDFPRFWFPSSLRVVDLEK